MIRGPRFASWVPAVLALALMLRGLFPAGYMPGAGGAIQLCPHGLPAAALLVGGHDHAHHEHHQHHHLPVAATDRARSAPDPLTSTDFERCSLGEALTLLASFDPGAAVSAVPETGPAPGFGKDRRSAVETLPSRARGPPRSPPQLTT
jgi:hypothetical protein